MADEEEMERGGTSNEDEMERGSMSNEADIEGSGMNRSMADDDDMARGVGDRAARADRAAPTARKKAVDNPGRGRVEPESGYAVLEDEQLQQLEHLCLVLDINYNQKLKEFGLKQGKRVKARILSQVVEFIDRRKKEKNDRFEEMKCLSIRLIQAWKQTHVPLKKVSVLHEAFSLVDAESSDDITAAKSLRTSLEDELKAEADRLELGPTTEKRTKYETMKIKLKKLMNSTHLVGSDIDIDLDKQVDDKELSEAISAMKVKIHAVKSCMLDRKELVFRIQTVQDAISNAWPFKTVKVLLQRAKLEACSVEASCPDILRYDGLDLAIFLARLEKAALSVLDAAVEANLQEPPATNDFARSTTRSGARFFGSAPVTVNADRERSLNKNLDWNDTDKKRMVNVVYRVRDLDATVESYIDDFQMNLFRKVEHPEWSCTDALVGFEHNAFALKLLQCDDVDTFDIGEGFGNIGIACEVHESCERLQTSERCKIRCRPARVKNNSDWIASVQERNGYLFELVEKAPFHRISHVMLRVTNLDRSIAFYEKALGMKLSKRMNLPQYECAIAHLGYGGVRNGTILSLTSNYEVEEYSKGDTFMQITIGTDNVERSMEAVEKTIEELGGEVNHRPVQGDKDVAAFQDPDGFRVVFVDNENFLKEVASLVANDPEGNAST